MSLTNYFKNKRYLRAIREGDFDRAIQLAKCGADVNIFDPSGWPLLTFMVVEGREDMVKFLLDMKADPNLPGLHGITPGMRAIGYRENTILDILLKCPDINVNQADDKGDTMLIYGLRCLNEDGVRRLINDGRVDLRPGGKNDPMRFMSSLEKNDPNKKNYEYLVQMIQNASRDQLKSKMCVQHRHASDNVCLARPEYYLGF